MMRKHPFRFVLAGCALALAPVTVQAQQVQVEAAQQPAQTATDQDYEARRVDPSARSLPGANTVQGFLATKLMLGNNTEIELSQLAVEKAEHPPVKQFAQKMVQAHTQLNQKLQQLLSGQSPAGQQDRPGAAANAADRAPVARPATAGQQPEVPPQLAQVARQSAQNYLQMTKQMLQRYEGQDFDMAYMGSQVVLHTRMLSDLQAMQGVGSPQFQQLVSQAEQATTEHLQTAQQLARKFEDDRKTADSGSRSNNPVQPRNN